MRFFGLFRAKMTTVGIQNPKLIVTNDYQQILAHFDWFLSLFQISYVKPELSPVELKVGKNGIFWAKNLFKKKFPRLFLSPNPSYAKMVPKQVFTGAGFKSSLPPYSMSIQEAPSCRVNLKLIGVTEKDLILHTQIISIINTFDFLKKIMTYILTLTLPTNDRRDRTIGDMTCHSNSPQLQISKLPTERKMD